MKKVIESKDEVNLNQVQEGSTPTGKTYVSHTRDGKLGGTMILVHIWENHNTECYQWIELRSPCISLCRPNIYPPSIGSAFASRKSAIKAMFQYGSDVYEIESDEELIKYIFEIKSRIK